MKIFKDNKEFATVVLGEDGQAVIESSIMEPETFQTMFDIVDFAGKRYTAEDEDSKGWICGLFQQFNARSHYRAVWEEVDSEWNDMSYREPYKVADKEDKKNGNKFLKSIKK